LFLAGSSMGGWASAWFAASNPGAVTACALLAPAFRFPEAHWNRLTAEERGTWEQTGLHRLTNQWVDLELGYPLVAESSRFPLAGLANQWKVPLAIFHGI